ncbi:MAG: alcohol dehydrogenase class IV [Paraglaciecola sp.]
MLCYICIAYFEQNNDIKGANVVANIFLPKIMKIGAGAIDLLEDILASIDCRNPCIITDKTMLELDYVDKITNQLSANKIRFGVFSETMPEPSEESILGAVKQVKTGEFDCLIALGGGSAIDSAKAIALLASHGGKMRDYKVPYQVHLSSLPIIAIPTTAGTGSEATIVTIITDADNDEKMLCMGPGLMATAAIIDYELTLSLPPRVAADTGIDALTHAIEAYVSRKANLFSDQQAKAAMQLIAPNLLKSIAEPLDTSAREAVMLGATLAGIAFSNASVALVHGMSRPIGVHFHVPHGMSNAMLLPTITEYSVAGAPLRYAECALFMGLVDNIDDLTTAHTQLISELQKLNRSLNVPTLAEFGVEKERFHKLIPLMAEQAQGSGSPGNNPRVPSLDEMRQLYQALWV